MMIASEKKMARPTCCAAATTTRGCSSYGIGLIVLGRLGELPVGVLDHHDRRVDQHADRERDAAERHDVGGDAEVVHRE